MRVLLFVIFIIMIIIFLNELINITSSYLKINYYRDVSELNIRNNCNNIFCEAETGRFNLAKNSYKLILPNDNFNSKNYYFALLFITIILFLMFLYKFWNYNKKSVEYYSDIDGRIFISYLFMFPYLITFVVVVMLTVMIVRRYAPTNEKGYQAYFVKDNKSENINNISVNINTILEYSNTVISILFVLWFVFSIFSNIPRLPLDNYNYGNNTWLISLVYIVALIITLYLMLNIINIVFTFNENTKPNLDFANIFNRLKDNVSKLKVIGKDKLIKSLAIDFDDTFKDEDFNIYSLLNNGDNFISSILIDNKIKDIKFEDTYPYKIIDPKDYDIKKNDVKFIHKYIHNIYDTEENHIELINNNFKKYSKLEDILIKVTGEVTGEVTIDYLEKYFKNKKIFKIKNIADNTEEEKHESDVYKNASKSENNINLKLINIICNFTNYIIHSYLIKEIDYYDDYDEEYMEKYKNGLKMYKLFNYIDELNIRYSKMSNVSDENAFKFRNEFKLYLNVYNEFSINEEESSSQDIIDKKLNKYFIDNYAKYLNDYGKKDDNYEKTFSKNIMSKCKDLANYRNSDLDFDLNNSSIFSKDNDFSSIYNSDDEINADISYNSENTYYQKYFNIAGEKSFFESYDIGNYKYKNIEELLTGLFIIVIIIVILTFITMLFQENIINNNPFEILGKEIVTPFVCLFILVLFIYIFMNFNTKYNLYFIFSVLDSFYKRDLLQYNNIITPFIRLHDNNNDIGHRDYTKHYIITNVIASIISNNLIIKNVNYNEKIFSEEDTTDVSQSLNDKKLDVIASKFRAISDNTLLAIKDDVVNIISNYEEFKMYNMKIFENIDNDFKNEFKNNVNEETPEIYNFIYNLNLKDNSDIDKLIDKNSVSKDIKKFIENNISIILRIIIECEDIFENDYLYDEQYSKLKFFEFYSDKKIFPHKFIIKIKNYEEFKEFIGGDSENSNDMRFNMDEKKLMIEEEDEEDEEDKQNEEDYKLNEYEYINDKIQTADIIENFLKIVYHMKYNFQVLKLTNINDIINSTYFKEISKEYLEVETLSNEEIKKYYQRMHKIHNKKLLHLIKKHEPSSGASELYDSNFNIDDTFRHTIPNNIFDSKETIFYKRYIDLKYISNLFKDYDSSHILNENNNHLKNVVKTTYKQINDENVKFIDRDKNTIENNYGIPNEVNKKYNEKSDAIINTIDNANYFTGHGLLLNYFVNAVLILVIYNLGNN